MKPWVVIDHREKDGTAALQVSANGIEIPNAEIAMLQLYDAVRLSPDYKTINGEVFWSDRQWYITTILDQNGCEVYRPFSQQSIQVVVLIPYAN
jgi:hypothetical protein